MIVRDKQDLRKCVKQSVRRAMVADTAVGAGAFSGAYGVANWLGECQAQSLQACFEALCQGSPFSDKPAELLSALDALNLPVHDLDKAQTIIDGYDQSAYLSLVLDALRAGRILVETQIDEPDPAFKDERIAPLLVVNKTLFVPGRYGVDYAMYAQMITEEVQAKRAKDVKLAEFDENALTYCLMPVCEDLGLVLHIHLADVRQGESLARLMEKFPTVHVLLSADASIEAVVLQMLNPSAGLLMRVMEPANLPAAFRRFGVQFVPFASHASSLEQLLGSWIRAKEVIWQALCDAYLPLARTGYELTREQIDADTELLFGGNLAKFYDTYN